MRLQVGKTLLQNPHIHFSSSGIRLGVYSLGILPQKSFAFPELLETQERYFLSTRKDINFLSASTYNYLTCNFCYEVNWLFRFVLLNSLYDVQTVFKKNTWANLERDIPPVQTGPGTQPASCTMGTGSFSGVKCGRGVLLTTHPLLAPRSWKSRAIPLPTFWTTPDLSRNHFTFFT